MKRPVLLTALLSGLLLGACFDDDGNYGYKHLDAPVWKINDNEAISISCREGADEEVYFNGGDYYTWGDADSLQRASEVRYEWKINGIVIATEPSVRMPVTEFIQKAGITSFGSDIPGSFAIIEKETDIVYMVSVRVSISKIHGIGDWVVLSEQPDGSSKLSFIKRRSVQQENQSRQYYFELQDNYYEEINGSGIPGSPWSMAYSYGATNVSELGSLSVLTSQGAYEINPETFLKVQEIKEDFSGTPPDDLIITDRQDAWGGSNGTGGLLSLISTQDGRVFTKTMTKNNLGGSFISEPYVADEKGYKITGFGSTRTGYTCVPCYDEKNHRVMGVFFQQSGDSQEYFPGMSQPVGPQFMISKMYPLRQPSFPVSGVPPVENMPDDTEILSIGMCGNYYYGMGFSGTDYYLIGMVYNTQGRTMLGKCAVIYDKNNAGLLGDVPNVNTLREFPGGNLDRSSVILFVSWYSRQHRLLYSKGNKVFFLNSNNDYAQSLCIELPDSSDKITCMKCGIVLNYNELLIGTEKGKIYYYDSINNAEPQLRSTLDVQGKVVDLKELFDYEHGDSDKDNY